ncbi:hypothetical protein V5799_012831 [Amblyomma americanum]|uniref:Uncharacterized protein n=1 Tax=Amblyomma americanum TaxID=6943 RepID=A0AAQ4E7N9_AMBAM
MSAPSRHFRRQALDPVLLAIVQIHTESEKATLPSLHSQTRYVTSGKNLLDNVTLSGETPSMTKADPSERSK